MLLEVAEIYIKDGTQSQFEAAMKQSLDLYVGVTEGYISGEIRQSLETPTRYLLLIKWASLEAHEENFRASDRFQSHRALVSPFFAKAPYVEHFQLCK